MRNSNRLIQRLSLRLYFLCFFPRHQPKKAPKGLGSMTLGQKVIGRKNDGWYYHCTIVGMATQTFYEVSFDDGSYCDNLQPENVLVSVWQSDSGPRSEILWVILIQVERKYEILGMTVLAGQTRTNK